MVKFSQMNKWSNTRRLGINFNSHPQLLVDEVHELCFSPGEEDDVCHVVGGQLVVVDVVHFTHVMGAQEGIVCNLTERPSKLLIPHNGLEGRV